jgi:hypothetical protein
MVSVEVVELLVTVAGLKPVVTPAGVPLGNTTARAFEVQVSFPAHVVVIAYVAEDPAVTGFGFCVPMPTAVMVSGVAVDTTKLNVELVCEFWLLQFALPAALTESPLVVAAGVVAEVVIVRVDVPVPPLFTTVAGLKDAPAPLGSVPPSVSAWVVQVPPLLKVTVTKYVALDPWITGFGVWVPTATEETLAAFAAGAAKPTMSRRMARVSSCFMASTLPLGHGLRSRR